MVEVEMGMEMLVRGCSDRLGRRGRERGGSGSCQGPAKRSAVDG